MPFLLRTWWVVFIAIGCDKATTDFEAGRGLEGRGDVIAAGEAYQRAVSLDSGSASGKAAAERLATIRPAIEKAAKAEFAAMKITESWCVQMSDRIFQRYFEAEQGKQASRPPSQRHPLDYLEQVIRDHTNNAQVNCKDDAFKGVNGEYWKCVWNSKSGHECDKLKQGN